MKKIIKFALLLSSILLLSINQGSKQIQAGEESKPNLIKTDQTDEEKDQDNEEKDTKKEDTEQDQDDKEKDNDQEDAKQDQDNEEKDTEQKDSEQDQDDEEKDTKKDQETDKKDTKKKDTKKKDTDKKKKASDQELTFKSLIKKLGLDGDEKIAITKSISYPGVTFSAEGYAKSDQKHESKKRELALSPKNKTGKKVTLKIDELNVESNNFVISGGTLDGDVFVDASGFKLEDATITGNLIFSLPELLDEFKKLPKDQQGTVKGKLVATP